MKKYLKKGYFFLLLILIIFTLIPQSYVQAQRGNSPPPEAFRVCRSKSIHSSCTLNTPRGKLQGHCLQTPYGTACVPSQHERQGSQPQNNPPQIKKAQPGTNPPKVRVNRTSDAQNPEKAISNVTDTGQKKCFDSFNTMECTQKGQYYYGQDSQYTSKPPAYRDNHDGTISDLNTGLMWQKTPDLNNTMNWYEAHEYAKNSTLANYTDWRLPTIKELTSIATFDGNLHHKKPFINTNYFDFKYPDASTGLRNMDAQYISSNKYLGTVMDHQQCFFGFNYADGHIKCYPLIRHLNPNNDYYVRLVRGNKVFDNTHYLDNGDGTITDTASGLMWQKSDDNKTRNWKDALFYAENLELAGHNDWRLPNVKELQSLVDYTRNSPAINPIFNSSNSQGWYWSSTSYEDSPMLALYIAFGKAIDYKGLDTHGAGAMRGDFKSGNPAQYPKGLGPQADQVRIYNYVRCVRSIK